MKYPILIIYMTVLISCATTQPNIPSNETSTCAKIEKFEECIQELKTFSNNENLEAFEKNFNLLCQNSEVHCERAKTPKSDHTFPINLKKAGDGVFRLEGKNGDNLYFAFSKN